jgi:methionine-gamma-lyase
MKHHHTTPSTRRRRAHPLAHRSTTAVHAGREDFATLQVHAPPLDLSTTYPTPDLDVAGQAMEELAQGAATAKNSIYARLHNPTVARFEQALAALESAEAAVAFGSGMAAITACLLAARSDGNHVVAVRPLYGTTDHLLDSGLLGVEVTWADQDGVAAALRPDTSLVLIETPGNPTLPLVDIAHVAKQAGKVPVAVDSTFATPVLQQPLLHGAAMVVHSATKYLGGHGDVIAGVVATSEAWATRLRHVRVLTGALLHPLGGYLLHRGLATLWVRVERAQATAQILAERLANHPAVSLVLYPGLPGNDPRGLVRRQMQGPGAMVAFHVRGGYEAAASVMSHVSLIVPAVSLGGVNTLIQHPAGLTHRSVDAAARKRCGIDPDLLRLSVGLEHPEDLWDDLDRALSAAQKDRAGSRPEPSGVGGGMGQAG